VVNLEDKAKEAAAFQESLRADFDAHGEEMQKLAAAQRAEEERQCAENEHRRAFEAQLRGDFASLAAQTDELKSLVEAESERTSALEPQVAENRSKTEANEIEVERVKEHVAEQLAAVQTQFAHQFAQFSRQFISEFVSRVDAIQRDVCELRGQCQEMGRDVGNDRDKIVDWANGFDAQMRKEFANVFTDMKEVQTASQTASIMHQILRDQVAAMADKLGSEFVPTTGFVAPININQFP